MDDQLIKQLRAWNPWWNEGAKGIERFGVPAFKRDEYQRISDSFLARKQAVSIVGMRQVGKTTIMHQCIRELLDKGVRPQNVFFVSFEDSYLLAKFNVKTLFKDVIDSYANNVLNEEIANTNEKLYFLFDEVHRLPNWAQAVKTYFDQNMPIAFMVSGSASFGLQTMKGDSLLGRMNEFVLYPFSFHEAVLYWTEENSDEDDSQKMRIRELLDQCRDVGSRYFKQGELKKLYEYAQKTYTNLSVWYGDQLYKYLRRYVLEGGFPRVWQQKDEYSKHRHLVEQHLQKVIREDLPQMAKIRKVKALETLYIGILDQIGDEFILSKLANQVNLSPLTLEQYIEYLKKTFLVYSIERTKSKNIFRHRRASNVKFYALDSAVRAAVVKTREDVFEDPNEMSVYAENLVSSSLHRRIGKMVGNGVRYYREGNKYEVDFILKEADSMLPIEVKWRDNIPALMGLDRICRKWELEESVLITRAQKLTYRNGRLSLPLWLFLLLD